jgi:hypothetical protein
MSGRLILASLMVIISGCVAPLPPPPPAPVYVAAPPAGPTLADRLAADEERIRDGLRLGQFTGPEYNELQRRHDAIEGTRREQLALGGGRFAPGQYEQLVGREEALSRTIFDYRHNGATPTAH